jgi:hydrogenase maturation protein HypF
MARARCRVELCGIVQGVGLRPWAARTALAFGLGGGVRNTGAGVRVELDGERSAIEAWLAALREESPAQIEFLERTWDRSRGTRDFGIEASDVAPTAAATRIPPDVAVCPDCLRELFDPRDRRYRHPFCHCARCGPRASVLRALPFDRERTSLAAFPMCDACRREYADPSDRRHHAQTLACPACGPRLRALDAAGRELAGDPLERAARQLAAGAIVALKGYGGFHLAVDATRADAVARLRKRKGRPVKAFALAVPDLASARSLVRLSPADERLLEGPSRAIVVAPRRPEGCAARGLADAVAPGTHDLGLLLPHAPVQHLLFFAPRTRPGRDAPRFSGLVLTSANRSDEPTLHADADARERLAGIADLLLVHDREVARPSDDSVFRSAPDGPIPIRLSRSTAPRVLPLPVGLRADAPVLALGGDRKSAPALALGEEILLAEHVGDLANADAADALVERAARLARLLGVRPQLAVHDAHPDSLARGLAGRLAPRCLEVQHHHAHSLACLAEHGRAGPALALVLDGAGFGADGSVWGGELLRVEARRAERLAHLEPVPLPGGDAAVREPWRMAAVWLGRAFPEGAPPLPWHRRRDPARVRQVEAIAARGLHSPATSSAGRLFDAIASLLDACDVVSHEGEAALALESLAAGAADAPPGSAFACPPVQGQVVPVADLVRDLVLEHAGGADRARVASAFHEQLAARLAAFAIGHAGRLSLDAVALTGGCFQNRILLTSLAARLRAAGLEPLIHRRLPPNDAALAVGQAVAAIAGASHR